MEMAKVTSKGQITIPISIRRRLGINEGDKILFINKQEGVMMLNPDTVEGDVAEYTEEAAPQAKAAAAPPKPAKSPAAAPKSSPAPEPAPEPAPAAAAQPDINEAAPEEPPRRKYIPPAEDDYDAKPAAKAGGIDLSTLLDDIRSIGKV